MRLTKMLRGGGARVLTLILVLAIMMSGMISLSNRAHAADEGYDLYYYSDPMVTQANGVLTDISNNHTFKSLGFSAQMSTACAVDTNNQVWAMTVPSPKGSDMRISKTTASCGNKMGGTYDYSPKFLDSRDTATDAVIDREGYFWRIAGEENDFSGRLPYSEYDFYAVSDRNVYRLSGSNGRDYILLGKPREQKTATYIGQMPTTGAPDGLSSVGLVAVGLGLMGVALGLMRRHSF